MKGYWIAHVDISDPNKYEGYRLANGPAFAKYGGKFLVRAGRSLGPEGQLRSRTVLIEFESYDKAVECYHSPEYQAAKAKRDGISEGDLVIIEGYDGPQPGDE